MAKAITNGETLISATKVPLLKKTALCIQTGSSLKVYAYFTNEENADEFMERLAKFCFAKKEADGNA